MKRYGICAIAGIVLLIGTAGASDLGTITFGRTLLQAVIAMGLSLYGILNLEDCVVNRK